MLAQGPRERGSAGGLHLEGPLERPLNREAAIGAGRRSRLAMTRDFRDDQGHELEWIEVILKIADEGAQSETPGRAPPNHGGKRIE